MQDKEHIHDFHLGGAPQQDTRRCDWRDCKDEGLYRAPYSRGELRKYRWFCMSHIRQYNAAWNYYAGMNEEEVEADVRKDTVWNRPSWPFGEVRGDSFFSYHNVNDDFGLFEGKNHHPRQEEAPTPHRNSPEAKAMGVLGLVPPLTVENVKARYKVLVKRYHPDTNGGDKASEEKFKLISQAYGTIMDSLNP